MSEYWSTFQSPQGLRPFASTSLVACWMLRAITTSDGHTRTWRRRISHLFSDPLHSIPGWMGSLSSRILACSSDKRSGRQGRESSVWSSMDASSRRRLSRRAAAHSLYLRSWSAAYAMSSSRKAPAGSSAPIGSSGRSSPEASLIWSVSHSIARSSYRAPHKRQVFRRDSRAIFHRAPKQPCLTPLMAVLVRSEPRCDDGSRRPSSRRRDACE